MTDSPSQDRRTGLDPEERVLAHAAVIVLLAAIGCTVGTIFAG